MYLDTGLRGRGIAQAMLDFAQTRALALGFSKIILSLQKYKKRLFVFIAEMDFITSEQKLPTPHPSSGGWRLARLYFEKPLDIGQTFGKSSEGRLGCPSPWFEMVKMPSSG